MVEPFIKEVNIKAALKSSILVVQKAAAPKNGVEFRQGSIGTIRSSLAMSYDVSRRRVCVGTFLKVVLRPTIHPTYLSLDASLPKHKNWTQSVVGSSDINVNCPYLLSMQNSKYGG